MPASHLASVILALSTPAVQDELSEQYASIEVQEVTLRYLPAQFTDQDARTLAGTFAAIRTAYFDLLAIEPPSPEITVRVRKGAPRFYYLLGKDRVAVDYPSLGSARPVVPNDLRVGRFARYLFAQIWLYQWLSSTAGLEPLLLDSIADYLDHLMKTSSDPHSVAPPQGPGQVWYSLDQLYEVGMTSFLLNNLVGEQIAGHQVLPFLRQRVVDLTEDSLSAGLFDLLGPSQPVFAQDDLEPGTPLAPGSPLRPSRMALWNGVRLLDTEAPSLSAAEKFRDFDDAFEKLARSYPDAEIRGETPQINGVDLWRLYAEFRPRVEYSRDNIDFYLVMRELFARLGDRFTAITSPHGAPEWRSVPGVSLEVAGDEVVVAQLTPDSAAAQAGVKPGMILVAVDGRSTADLLQSLGTYFLRCGGCQNERLARLRAVNVLLTGPRDSEAEIVLRPATAEATAITLRLARALPGSTSGNGSERPERKIVEHELRPDGVGVIKIRAFLGTALLPYSKALEELAAKNARGVVLDLRGNEVGDPKAAFTALGRMVDREVSLGSLVGRNTDQPMGSVQTLPINVPPIPNVQPYLGPAVVLVDSWTGGSAELFALGFQLANRGPVIGKRTSGQVTQPMAPSPFLTLNTSGLVLSLTQNTLVHRGGGSMLQAGGVQPTEECETTAEQYAAGVDGVLERAVQLLQR